VVSRARHDAASPVRRIGVAGGAVGLVAESAEPVYFSKLATFRKPVPAPPR